MKTEAAKLADLLRRFADAIETLDESGIRSLLNNPAAIRQAVSKPKRASKTAARKIDTQVLNDALSQLQAAATRLEGATLLETLKLNRSELVALAKAGNVHVMSEDTVKRLEEKLVESLIGSRLNSQAIRGTSQRPADETNKSAAPIDPPPSEQPDEKK